MPHVRPTGGPRVCPTHRGRPDRSEQRSLKKYSTYDFANWENDVRFAGSFLNATDPDLSDFEARGGKLILWHGWSDAALNALHTIDHSSSIGCDASLTSLAGAAVRGSATCVRFALEP